MKNYLVVCETTLSSLEEVVNRYLQSGYEPISGVVVIYKHISIDKFIFYQTLIRRT